MMPRKITNMKQAQHEASRRWGRWGIAKVDGKRRVVGVQHADRFEVAGSGDTWEQAFDSAAAGDGPDGPDEPVPPFEPVLDRDGIVMLVAGSAPVRLTEEQARLLRDQLDAALSCRACGESDPEAGVEIGCRACADRAAHARGAGQ